MEKYPRTSLNNYLRYWKEVCHRSQKMQTLVWFKNILIEGTNIFELS